jgi:tetratricopeptide (TPR) repeat protein
MNTSRPTSLIPGRILCGRYQIVSQLGQGGFGKTFLAKDNCLPGQPQCVVKQLVPSANDPDTLEIARRLFDTEARMLHKLGTHPQIPQLFAYFEEDKEFYLVQEYIEGEDLDRELNTSKTCNEEDIIVLVREILEVLAFVHQQNVIHRDVNPSNIIRRREDSKLVLIDFGAVKQITTQIVRSPGTNYTIAIGTPGYFPSEQAIGSPRLSSDVYAVGIIAISALTGCSPEKLPVDSQTGELNWHSLIKVSPGLTRVLDTMVRYDFRQRYCSAVEAKTAIAQLIDGNKTAFQTKVAIVPPQKTLSFQDKKWLKKWWVKGSIASGIVGLSAGTFVGVNAFLTSNNAINLYQQGNTLYELENYQKALQSYEKAIAIRPEYDPAWKGKGDALQALNRLDEATNAYEKAIQIDPKSWEARIGRAQVLARLGKSSEAIESFKTALEIEPDASEAWQGLAQIQINLKQYSEAIYSLDRLLVLDSENAFAWYQKGWAWQNLREYKKAIKDYDKATKIKPDLASAWYQKGNVAMNLQEYQEATTAYEKAVQFQPKLEQAWYSMGIAMSQLGRDLEALDSFTQATKIRSNYGEAWYQKAWILHKLKRYDEALTAYETLIRLFPRDEKAWYSKGNVLYNQQNYESAIAAYQQTVALKKDYYQAWNSLANALMQVKRYQEAIDAYDRALRYQPDSQQAQQGKAQAESLLLVEKEKEREENRPEENQEERDNEDTIIDEIKDKILSDF